MTKLFRRIISIILSLVICFGFAIHALAVDPYAQHGTCFTKIAQTQVGYTEGANKVNKYGWADHWCGMFVGWCSEQAGLLDIIPDEAHPIRYKEFYEERERYYPVDNGDTFEPQVGDLYFAYFSSDDPGHIGIVVGVSSTHITVVDGNWGSAPTRVVQEQRVRSGDSCIIVAYARPDYSQAHNITNWTYGNSSHWGTCNICQYTLTELHHDWEYNSSGHWCECSVCEGEVSTQFHSYNWTYNANTHTKTCTICGYSSTYAHSYEINGYSAVCTYCGYVSEHGVWSQPEPDDHVTS